jgi:drug/metabolite transporter, DME family
MPERRIGYLFVVLAAALWAVIGPVSRLLLREGITPLEMAFWRAAIAWLLFLGHVMVRRGRDRAAIATHDLGGIAAFGLVAVALLYAAFPLAVRAGGAALAVVLLYTAPAWVAVASALFLRERLGARKLAALAMTLTGIVGVAFAGAGPVRPSPSAIGWGLASGLSYGSLYLFGKRYFALYPTATVFAWALPVAALVLFPFTEFHAKSSIAWAGIIGIGACSTYGAYLAYSAGLARLDATRASTVATVEPLFATALAFVFWNERFAPLGYVAALLVLVGVVVMSMEPSARSASEPGGATNPTPRSSATTPRA